MHTKLHRIANVSLCDKPQNTQRPQRYLTLFRSFPCVLLYHKIMSDVRTASLTFTVGTTRLTHTRYNGYLGRDDHLLLMRQDNCIRTYHRSDLYAMCVRSQADARVAGGEEPDGFGGRGQGRHGSDLCELCPSRVWKCQHCSSAITVDFLVFGCIYQRCLFFLPFPQVGEDANQSVFYVKYYLESCLCSVGGFTSYIGQCRGRATALSRPHR